MLKDSVRPRYNTEIPESWFMTVNMLKCLLISLFCYSCFSALTAFMAFFGKHPNTEWVCSLSECQSVNKADTLPHQRLGTQITGACPFTLHPLSHCSSSLPLLSQSLQGQRSAAALWLLWLCRSQQGCSIRSTGSTTCSETAIHMQQIHGVANADSKM